MPTADALQQYCCFQLMLFNDSNIQVQGHSTLTPPQTNLEPAQHEPSEALRKRLLLRMSFRPFPSNVLHLHLAEQHYMYLHFTSLIQ